MKICRGILAAALVSMLGACASGPKLAEVLIPPKPADQGRIYFYRTLVMGAAVQPSIRLNGQRVGDCQPKGVFYKDLPPGDYEATVATEVEHKLTFALARGEEKYIRCSISMGFFIGHPNLTLVNPGQAQAEMRGLAFTGGSGQ